MNMLSSNETNNAERESLKKFHRLKIALKIDVLNFLSLTAPGKLMEFLNAMNKEKGEKIAEKMITAHRESNETLKIIRKIQEEKRCTKQCKKVLKRSDENVYGSIKLLIDITKTLTSLVFAVNGLYAGISFILSMDHFDSELIQHEYSLIHGFHIEAANIVLIIVVCTNQLICIFYDFYTLQINGWKKVFVFLPFFPNAFITLQKLDMMVKKYTTQKDMVKENAKTQTNWGHVLKLVHRNRNIQLQLEKIDANTSSKKGITAVLRNTTLNILILSIYTHPNARALLERSLTKDIPCFLPAMLLGSILSICLAVRSFKNKNRESFFSISTLVSILAIFAAFLPRSFLIMLMSLDRPVLMIVPIFITCLLTFAMNQTSNTIFQSQSFVERLSYSLISSTVPITIRDIPGHVDEKAEERRSLNFKRKKTFSQGLTSFMLNLVGILR